MRSRRNLFPRTIARQHRECVQRFPTGPWLLRLTNTCLKHTFQGVSCQACESVFRPGSHLFNRYLITSFLVCRQRCLCLVGRVTNDRPAVCSKRMIAKRSSLYIITVTV